MSLRAVESTDDDPRPAKTVVVVERPERKSEASAVAGSFPVPGLTMAWAKSVSADVYGIPGYIFRCAFGAMRPHPNANGDYNGT